MFIAISAQKTLALQRSAMCVERAIYITLLTERIYLS